MFGKPWVTGCNGLAIVDLYGGFCGQSQNQKPHGDAVVEMGMHGAIPGWGAAGTLNGQTVLGALRMHPACP